MAKQQQAVAAIIPLHNGGKYIEGSLNSILSQSVLPTEVVVVDDGSTDDGPIIVEAFADRNEKIRLVRQQQEGQSSARNRGAREVKEALLAFLDQDDLWLPDHIENLIEPFAERRARPLGWVYSDVDLMDERGCVFKRSYLGATNRGEEHPKRTLAACLRNDMMVWVSSAVISHEAFDAVGGFDETLRGYEDDDLWLRFFQAGFDNVFVPEVSTRVRRHGASATHSDRMKISRGLYGKKLLEAYENGSGSNANLVKHHIIHRFVEAELRDIRRCMRTDDHTKMVACMNNLKGYQPYLDADTERRVVEVTSKIEAGLLSTESNASEVTLSCDFGAEHFSKLPSVQPQEISQSDIFAALQAAFWNVRDPVPSAWSEHIPFLFSLVSLLKPRRYVELGVHHGASFLAACQAVERMQLRCNCVAIDSWIGDPHAGRHVDSVFTDFRNNISKSYDSFAGYIRKNFDSALEQFEDSSVDLLHIDGFHSFDAVRNDFTTWQPKLSDVGVVLFHDVNEYRADFGVWRFWNQIRKQYPSFAFGHGHGLGVLIVGEHSPLRRPIEGRSASLLSDDILDLAIVLFGGLGQFPETAIQKPSKDALQAKDNRIRQLEMQISEFQRSTSWRITKPLRALARALSLNKNR
ncbi:hypothetical protein AUC71_04320 [Methyloceanibacter marginalis]|uniref:Glycosyltransferase 2-like domain-containing protein n=1 Tax=Methyloceanibacter marginalis TaxID=1774971 RepID=A0A1E3VTD7_9HYPH|nr:glycosyltransferase [Methyloceanibacter marginalis]ODR96798.1 hypothetical protein AUC71_04320 [Methyloceanibacter marginalis]